MLKKPGRCCVILGVHRSVPGFGISIVKTAVWPGHSFMLSWYGATLGASLHSAFARSISLFISEICALQAYGHEAKGHDRHVECHEEPAAAFLPLRTAPDRRQVGLLAEHARKETFDGPGRVLGRDDGSARTATARRGRAAQLFAGFAHRGARLIDDADPEHEAVIDTVRGRQCAVLNFPAQNSSFLRGGSYSAVMTRTGGGCIPLSRA